MKISPETIGSQEDWSRRRESNPQPTHYECVALPLSYAGSNLYFLVYLISLSGNSQVRNRPFFPIAVLVKLPFLIRWEQTAPVASAPQWPGLPTQQAAGGVPDPD